jgi:hypothetical protein
MTLMVPMMTLMVPMMTLMVPIVPAKNNVVYSMEHLLPMNDEPHEDRSLMTCSLHLKEIITLVKKTRKKRGSHSRFSFKLNVYSSPGIKKSSSPKNLGVIDVRHELVYL